MADRTPLYYTFGNHMHWVDMQWLWGYHVLPGSIRDMLRFCAETGTKGNVNFDGVGYEKLAAEDPEALQELRQAVQTGIVEPVGCSYGQPYGLFHGGESNIRQRVYGVRAVTRLLGKRPRAFWEEEFDFFPQLPQMLHGVGFEYASLFFQWTWHTPHIPMEESPVVWWQGHDGSKLLTATRNKLNLHQWPEDMDILLSQLAESPQAAVVHDIPPEGTSPGPVDRFTQAPSGVHAASETAARQSEATQETQHPTPLILQWLELMPSPDWMCRSEILLPKMRQFLTDPRFELRPATLSEYLETARDKPIPVRSYSMDEVFHGMSLGKNCDDHLFNSRWCEEEILLAETLASLAGYMGRPYAQWDIYPSWELDEAWRELLQAQHHDNHECQGLCGSIGDASFERSRILAEDVGDRCAYHLANLARGSQGEMVQFNPTGWTRNLPLIENGQVHRLSIPPFGFTVSSESAEAGPIVSWVIKGNQARFQRGDFSVEVDLAQGSLTQIRTRDYPEGIIPPGQPWLVLTQGELPYETSLKEGSAVTDPQNPSLLLFDRDANGKWIQYRLTVDPFEDLLHVIVLAQIPLPEEGMTKGFMIDFPFAAGRPRLLVDQPYSITEVNPTEKFVKKYPKGDWMTSEQWFEEIPPGFTALSLVDFCFGESDSAKGVLLACGSHEQWFVSERGAKNLIAMNDPWDEDLFIDVSPCHYLIVPHGPMTNAERWRRAHEFRRDIAEFEKSEGQTQGPATFSALSISPENGSVVCTALYRESLAAAQNLPNHAARRMPENAYPFVARFVEFDGREETIEVTITGTVAGAYKTNLMGEIESQLQVDAGPQTSTIHLPLRPHEIATIMYDVEQARKKPRDLDAARHVWATVHRIEE